MAADPIDLSTVENATQWIVGGADQTDSQTLQSLVTAASRWAVRETGAVVDIWSTPGPSSTLGMSTLSTQFQITEVTDGNGANKLFLLGQPIQSLVSVQANGQSYQISTGYPNAGIVVTADKKSIAFRRPGLGQIVTPDFGYLFGSGFFPEGVQNIQAIYVGGYGAAGATVGAPNTPSDLEEAILMIVDQNYKRRNAVDQQSENVQGQGSTTNLSGKLYIPLFAKRIIRNYTRTAVLASSGGF